MTEHITLQVPMPDIEALALPRSKNRLTAVINKIHAARSLDTLFLELKDDLVALFNVEQLTLYAIDGQKKNSTRATCWTPSKGCRKFVCQSTTPASRGTAPTTGSG